MEADQQLNDLFGEAPYRTLVRGIRDFAILHIDRGGRIVSWNEGAARIFGHEEGEVVGQDFALLFTPEDRAGRRPRTRAGEGRERRPGGGRAVARA